MRGIVSVLFLFLVGFSFSQNEKLIGNWVGNDEGEYWRIELNEDESAVIIFYEDTVQSGIVDGEEISLKYKIQTKKGQTMVKFVLYQGKKKIQEYPCPVKFLNDHKMIFTFVEDEDDQWDVTMEKLM
jgi:hypothetical protein